MNEQLIDNVAKTIAYAYISGWNQHSSNPSLMDTANFEKWAEENSRMFTQEAIKSLSLSEKVSEENQRLRQVIQKVCEALGNGACCSVDSSLEFLEEVPKEVELVVKGLKSEINEADRRAGYAERKLASIQESANRIEAWLHKAKQEWGVSDNVSFDVVWEEALQLKKRGLVISPSNHSTFGYREDDDSLKGPFAVVE